MKIRKKITLWIAGASLLSTIIFSVFIVFELTELPFSLIDQELEQMARRLVTTSTISSVGLLDMDGASLPYTPDGYWIRVSDNDENILYESALTRYTEIPYSGAKTKYNLERHIPREQIWLGQDAHDDVAFRVKVIKASIDRRRVTIKIAKPIEDIEEEYIELARKYGISLLFCSIFIIVVSYKLAGRILQPVVSISSMAREINDESLDKRLPLSRSKDEFYELSYALNRMFDRLQFSFDRQKEFIGNASHELKSPLTLLKIGQEELLMNYDLSPSVRSNLERQLKTTLRMSRLVRSLLELSRLEHLETINSVPVDLKALIEQVVDNYRELFEDKNINVECRLSDDLALEGDPEKLFRLFSNLIDNSIRYNHSENGLVRIHGENKNGLLAVELSNTGERIPDKELELVFEQFYRVEKSRSVEHGGTGLGLSIAKRIVDLHGGTIAITNEQGGFVQVTLSLPVKA